MVNSQCNVGTDSILKKFESFHRYLTTGDSHKKLATDEREYRFVSGTSLDQITDPPI